MALRTYSTHRLTNLQLCYRLSGCCEPSLGFLQRAATLLIRGMRYTLVQAHCEKDLLPSTVDVVLGHHCKTAFRAQVEELFREAAVGRTVCPDCWARMYSFETFHRELMTIAAYEGHHKFDSTRVVCVASLREDNPRIWQLALPGNFFSDGSTRRAPDKEAAVVTRTCEEFAPAIRAAEAQVVNDIAHHLPVPLVPELIARMANFLQ